MDRADPNVRLGSRQRSLLGVGVTMVATLVAPGLVVASADPSVPHDATTEIRMAAHIASIDDYWRRHDATQGLYVSPRIAWLRDSDPLVSVCAEAASGDLGFYCRDDSTILLNGPLFDDLIADAGVDAAVAVLAHEWGHHIQHLVGWPDRSLQRELQADCYAGAYMAQGLESGFSSLTNAMSTLVLQGDRNYKTYQWFSEDLHGSPGLRESAFSSGGLSTIAGPDLDLCQAYAEYAPQAPIKLGPYLIARVPGLEYVVDGHVIRANMGVIGFALDTITRDSVSSLPSGRPMAEAAVRQYAERADFTWMAESFDPAPGIPSPFGRWTTLSFASQTTAGYHMGYFGLYVPDGGLDPLIMAETTPLDLETATSRRAVVSKVLWVLATSFICMPGASGAIGTPTYWFSCDIEQDE
jgi:hypothetical protein